MVLVQRYSNREMDLKREPKNRPTYIEKLNLTQLVLETNV